MKSEKVKGTKKSYRLYIFAAFLAVIMALSCVAIFAADSEDAAATDAPTEVGTFDALKTALTGDATSIKVTANIEITETIEITGDKTIDLNKKKITSPSGRAFWIKSGDVLITGTSGTITGECTDDSKSVIRVGGGAAASLTIDENIIVKTGSMYAITVFGGTGPLSLTVKGTVTNTYDGADGSTAISTNGNDNNIATITINAGAKVFSQHGAAIYMPSGNLNVTGGTIAGYTGIYQKAGVLNVTGGIIIGSGEKSPYAYNGNGCNPTGDAIVLDSCNYPAGAPSANITSCSLLVKDNNAEAIGTYTYGDAPEPSVTQTDTNNAWPAITETSGLFYPNEFKKIAVSNFPQESAFTVKFDSNLRSGGFDRREGWFQPGTKEVVGNNIGKAKGVFTDGTITIDVFEYTVSVKDVSAELNGTEYTKDEVSDAIQDAITSGGVLKVYTTNGSVTLQDGQTLKYTPAFPNNSTKGKITVKAPAITKEKYYSVEETKAENVITCTLKDNGPAPIEFNDGTNVTYKSSFGSTISAGTYKLFNNISGRTVTPLSGSGDVTIDLNGFTWTNTSESYPALLVRNSMNVTITGGGKIVSAQYGIWTSNGSVTVEDVEIEAVTHALYAEKGTITVNGGKYSVTNSEYQSFTLNAKDANYVAGTANIIVNGGSFYKFNPANNTAEGPNTNFVSAGKESVMEGDYYIVGVFYSVTYAITNGESIEPGRVLQYAAFESATISPNDHYALPANVTVTMGGNAFTDFTYANGKVTITAGLIEGNLVITAACVETFAITLETGGEGSGSINPATIGAQADGTEYSVTDNVLTIGGIAITAVPANADVQYTYAFDGWYIGENKITAASTITGATTFTAKFNRTIATYTVSFSVAGNGTVDTASVADVPYGSAFTVDGDKVTINGTTVTVTAGVAVEKYTYSFGGWSIKDGDTVAGDTAVVATVVEITKPEATETAVEFISDSDDGTVTASVDDIKSSDKENVVIGKDVESTSDAANWSVEIPKSYFSDKTENVSVTVTDVSADLPDTISDDQKKKLEGMTVISLNMTIGEKTEHQFGSKVVVKLAYTLKAGQSADSLYVYYVNTENGDIEKYDATYADGFISFETDHFSFWAVGDDIAKTSSFVNDGLFLASLLVAAIILPIIAGLVIFRKN